MFLEKYMTIQFNNEIKIFLTTNVDEYGNVLTYGFNTSNTREIVPIAGSFNLEQSRGYEYISRSNQYNTTSHLSVPTQAGLDLGTLTFSTTFSSSEAGPADAWLWNYLTANTVHPSPAWTYTAEAATLNTLRSSSSIAAFGIIIELSNTTYLVNNARVGSASISLDAEGLIATAWTLNFSNYSVLDTNLGLVPISTQYQITRGLSGNATRHLPDQYWYTTGKFLRTTIFDSNGVAQGTLAALGAELSITNSLQYLDNNGIDSLTFAKWFAGAGEQDVSGSLSIYTRGSGSYAYTLLDGLRKIQNDPYTYSRYGLRLELMRNSTDVLAEIMITPVTLVHSTSFDSVLSTTLDYKLVGLGPDVTCAIKFYT